MKSWKCMDYVVLPGDISRNTQLIDPERQLNQVAKYPIDTFELFEEHAICERLYFPLLQHIHSWFEKIENPFNEGNWRTVEKSWTNFRHSILFNKRMQNNYSLTMCVRIRRQIVSIKAPLAKIHARKKFTLMLTQISVSTFFVHALMAIRWSNLLENWLGKILFCIRSLKWWKPWE